MLIVYLAFRAIKSPDYRGRWGAFWINPTKIDGFTDPFCVYGETLAAIPLIRLIMQSHPELSITVTTTSPTGSAEVRKAFGDSVQHCYLPFDLPWCVRRFLRQVSPKWCDYGN